MVRQCMPAGYLPNAYNDSFEVDYRNSFLFRTIENRQSIPNAIDVNVIDVVMTEASALTSLQTAFYILRKVSHFILYY